MYAVFDHEYVDGIPKLSLPSDGVRQTDEERFARHCNLNCVNDKQAIAALWVEHCDKLKRKAAERLERRRNAEKRKREKS